jgi:hypothetical protein
MDRVHQAPGVAGFADQFSPANARLHTIQARFHLEMPALDRTTYRAVNVPGLFYPHCPKAGRQVLRIMPPDTHQPVPAPFHKGKFFAHLVEGPVLCAGLRACRWIVGRVFCERLQAKGYHEHQEDQHSRDAEFGRLFHQVPFSVLRGEKYLDRVSLPHMYNRVIKAVWQSGKHAGPSAVIGDGRVLLADETVITGNHDPGLCGCGHHDG